ncbi:hypothetical protein E1258_27640 [Micromonospora sp. KC207]|uniref:hypothetical protein n=1 Tax=Micromonospora sp. KC207 TaxID=2530377 RepID=UPI00104BEF4A|nr:hypothetical protein [Micromonospora sp. KC207]TDC48849.1 hypothetical protein E1258_27640 [Micromonospora sp. KC207]
MTAPAAQAPAVEISPTDLRALRFLAAGYTVRQTGTRLGLTGSAIAMRLLRMREHIGATTNAHAIAIAVRTGQLDLTETTR